MQYNVITEWTPALEVDGDAVVTGIPVSMAPVVALERTTGHVERITLTLDAEYPVTAHTKSSIILTNAVRPHEAPVAASTLSRANTPDRVTIVTTAEYDRSRG